MKEKKKKPIEKLNPAIYFGSQYRRLTVVFIAGSHVSLFFLLYYYLIFFLALSSDIYPLKKKKKSVQFLWTQ